jgi:hypothetical protein
MTIFQFRKVINYEMINTIGSTFNVFFVSLFQSREISILPTDGLGWHELAQPSPHQLALVVTVMMKGASRKPTVIKEIVSHDIKSVTRG